METPTPVATQSATIVTPEPILPEDCTIQNEQVSIERKSAFSITEKVEYVTYDYCNAGIISQYTMPRFTDFAGTLLMFMAVLIPLLLVGGLLNSAAEATKERYDSSRKNKRLRK